MRRKSIAALLVAVACLPSASFAQQRKMTLDELYQLAEEQSQSIKTFKTAVESATQGVKAAKAQRLPDIGASLSVGYLGDGLLSDRDFSDWQHIDNPHPTNNFALRAQQVVYSGGAITSGISLAELGKSMAELDWKKNRQEIRFIITAHYLDLCKLQNSQRVVEDNLRLTEQVISNMEARRNQGTALKTDITRYELQREALQLQRTKIIDAQMIISHQLVTTLHLPSATVIVADVESLEHESQVLAENEWQRIAADNNAGLKQSELAIKMNEKKVKLERAEMMPKVAIVAEEHFDGPITNEVPVIDKNINYWFAGIGVSYNISSLFKSNKKLRQQKTNLRQSREQHVVAQENLDNAVQATYTDYLTAFKELETQRKSVELADQCYKVTENRYKNGLALLTDMLDASNSKLSADLGLVDANINILYNYYKLKYIANTL
ncbi:MAG: TolC family protein [Prevotella sp.]